MPWDAIATIDAPVLNLWFSNHLIRKKPLIPLRANYLTVSVTDIDQAEGLHPWIRRLAQRRSEPEILTLGTNAFKGTAATAFHALQYYRSHPQDRAELGNGAALARIGAAAH